MPIIVFDDTYFMQQALKEAQFAFEENEIPIGAVIVANQRIVAKAHNLTERLNDVTAHAEMLAFTSASSFLGAKYLKDCTLYVTVEPCLMCAGASYWTQISRIVYGTKDEKRGFSKLNYAVLHPKTEIIGGVLETECAEIMSRFFKNRR